MDNKSDEQLIIINYTIEANRKDYDKKRKNLTEDFKRMITSTIKSMTDQIKILKYSPDQNS